MKKYWTEPRGTAWDRWEHDIAPTRLALLWTFLALPLCGLGLGGIIVLLAWAGGLT